MNIQKMMKQAQAMQQKMDEMQQKMADVEVEGESGGGMVKVVLNGQGEARKVTIDPKVIDPEDAETLEDLIVAGINNAKKKVEETTAEEMSKITGGLNLPPGMKMPF